MIIDNVNASEKKVLTTVFWMECKMWTAKKKRMVNDFVTVCFYSIENLHVCSLQDMSVESFLRCRSKISKGIR